MEAGRLLYLEVCLACPGRVLSQEAGQRLLVSWEETTGGVTGSSQRVPSLRQMFDWFCLVWKDLESFWDRLQVPPLGGHDGDRRVSLVAVAAGW